MGSGNVRLDARDGLGPVHRRVHRSGLLPRIGRSGPVAAALAILAIALLGAGEARGQALPPLPPVLPPPTTPPPTLPPAVPSTPGDPALPAGTSTSPADASSGVVPFSGPLTDERDLRGSSPASRGIQLSPWLTAHPFARFSAHYESNIFRSVEDPVSDGVLESQAGIVLTIRPGPRLSASVGYSIAQRTYVDDSELSGTDHRAFVALGHRTRRVELTLRGSAAYLFRPIDPRLDTNDDGVADSEGGVRQLDANALASLLVRLSRRFAVRGEGQLTYADYTPDDEENEAIERFDHQGWTGRGILEVSITRTISALGGAEVRDLLYTSDQAIAPDLRVYGVFVGGAVRGPVLEGELRIGYEQSSVLKARLDPDPDEPGGPLLALRLGWQATPRTLVALEATRRIEFSTGISSQVASRLLLEVRQGLTRTVDVFGRIGWELRQSDAQDDLYTYRLGAGISWRILDWLTVGSDAGWDRFERGSNDPADALRIGCWVMLAP
jgi:hypothetical protein